MFSLSNMSSTTSILSSYSNFAAAAMLVRTVVREVETMTSQLIPKKLQEKIISSLGGLFGDNDTSKLTLIIDEYSGLSINEIYEASEVYLSTKISPSIRQLKVSKNPQEKSFSVNINKGQKILDIFDEIQLVWEFVSTNHESDQTQQKFVDIAENYSKYATKKSQHRSVLLSFHKQHKEKVLNTYLPYVVDTSKAIRNEKKVVKLYSLGNFGNFGAGSGVNLNHPSTFDTLAMDPEVKKKLVDDLDRFVKRRDFYRRVGKPWKRGYLLYGPPGTGKSSLIAAMANYLKFDIYDMDLACLHGNTDFIRLLTHTSNRSILVIEDIDCSIELQNRQQQYRGYKQGGSDSQLTLSGLLNFIDGLWSSCGDERIIVFTTNYKDRLDPALIRPGRMDMHIHMSYCTPYGFKILASNYLNIKGHDLFIEIEQLIKEVEVTPAEIAEELMKSEDVDVALEELIGFLKRKKGIKRKLSNLVEENEQVNENENESQEMEEMCHKKRKPGNWSMTRGSRQEMENTIPFNLPFSLF